MSNIMEKITAVSNTIVYRKKSGISRSQQDCQEDFPYLHIVQILLVDFYNVNF